MNDKLTDFERAEYYKQRLSKAARRTIFFCMLTFILGIIVARVYYLWKYR